MNKTATTIKACELEHQRRQEQNPPQKPQLYFPFRDRCIFWIYLGRSVVMDWNENEKCARGSRKTIVSKQTWEYCGTSILEHSVRHIEMLYK
jgi:hypothetical protein